MPDSSSVLRLAPTVLNDDSSVLALPTVVLSHRRSALSYASTVLSNAFTILPHVYAKTSKNTTKAIKWSICGKMKDLRLKMLLLPVPL